MRRSASELTAHLGGELIGPDVGIVTSVERAHLQYLGDLDRRGPRQGRARGRLAGIGCRSPERRRLPRPGHGLAERVSRAGGWGGTDDVRADDVTLDRDLRARFRLSSPWGQTEVRLALHGVHQVPDALAAATVARGAARRRGARLREGRELT